MKHRIAAGVIVEEEGRILLVRHVKQGIYDFWVAPGGGAEGTEDLFATARREAFEETSYQIEPVQLAYIEEVSSSSTRHCKVWFTGRLVSGSIHAKVSVANQEHIVESAWLSRNDFEGKHIFPPMLLDQYWQDKLTGFASPRYVGLRAMEFY
jgi:8-oxo-dGTP diphosphatase